MVASMNAFRRCVSAARRTSSATSFGERANSASAIASSSSSSSSYYYCHHPPGRSVASTSMSTPRCVVTSLVGRTTTTTHHHHHHHHHHPASSLCLGRAGHYHHHNRHHYSTFVPPPNNVYHGMPVYPNVDISSSSSSSDDDDYSAKKKKNVSVAASARNADTEAVFVITGASRSMGLQFVKELMTRTSGRIVACVLRPGSTPDLDTYLGSLVDVGGDERHRVDVRRLDVTDVTQIERLVEEVGMTYGRVDGLFNVAGVLGDRVNTPGPETNLVQYDWEWAVSQMGVNAIGPMMLTSKFAPLLKARRGKDTYLRTTGCMESVVVNISARVASVDDNDKGGLAWYAYRMSKAALNAGVRASSHELRRQGTWTISLYPGMTDTAMSRPFQSQGLRDKGLIFPVDFTVGRLMDVVDGMDEEHSGGFYDWAGQSIPF